MPLTNDEMKTNIKNNTNEICRKVNIVDVLRRMNDTLAEEDEEEIRALNERRGNAVAMDKLLWFLPRRSGALRRFLAVLRHEDFNEDYDYLADRIEGISPLAPEDSSRPNRPPKHGANQQPASLAFPQQVSASNQDEIDGEFPGHFGTESYRGQTGGEPYTVPRGQAENIQSTVGVGGGPQGQPAVSSTLDVSSTCTCTSSVDISILSRRGEIPPRPTETQNVTSPCAFCNGNPSGSFFPKHIH